MAKYRANASEPWRVLKIKALDSMVIGSIIQFIGTTIPTGWLECNGATITQSDYPELYNLIGGTLPDYRGRVLVGQDTNDTDFDTLGETGGSKTDNLSKAYAKVGRSSASYASLQYTATSGSGTFNRKQSQGLGFDGSTETITDATALGGSVSTLQPYAVVKHIIKAKNTTPTMASIVNAYSTSTQDGYSCDYVNKLNIPTLLHERSYASGWTDECTIPSGTKWLYIIVNGVSCENVLIPTTIAKTYTTATPYFIANQSGLTYQFAVDGNNVFKGLFRSEGGTNTNVKIYYIK